jgi:drug/metabolite transporter (DMT)-like permease
VLVQGWVRYKKRELVVEPKYRGILLLRCVVGTISVNIQFYALSKMVLTDATVIILTSPIFTFFLVSIAWIRHLIVATIDFILCA